MYEFALVDNVFSDNTAAMGGGVVIQDGSIGWGMRACTLSVARAGTSHYSMLCGLWETTEAGATSRKNQLAARSTSTRRRSLSCAMTGRGARVGHVA